MFFNSLVLDCHPYVADEIFAQEEGVFGRRLVAGAMVFSYGLGLMAHNNTVDTQTDRRPHSSMPAERTR
jgi:acyl dehydratase